MNPTPRVIRMRIKGSDYAEAVVDAARGPCFGNLGLMTLASIRPAHHRVALGVQRLRAELGDLYRKPWGEAAYLLGGSHAHEMLPSQVDRQAGARKVLGASLVTERKHAG
jgi:hypothetical protein